MHLTNSQSSQAGRIRDYALISDCHGAALISTAGSIDWCCLPRFDAEPCFGRLLDLDRAGYCQIAPVNDGYEIQRHYLEDTMVLCTRFTTHTGSVQLFDFLELSEGSGPSTERQLIRIVEGLDGDVELNVAIQPSFGFGDIKPWLRQHDEKVFSAVGGSNGLVFSGDMGLELSDKYSVKARLHISRGDRRRLSIQFTPPETLDHGPQQLLSLQQIDKALVQTTDWWQRWSSRISVEDKDLDAGLRRSVIVLKALSYLPTGAIIAAPTTSLPAGVEANATWDYRYSWVRDATYTANALVKVGCHDEAFAFRRFVERSSAGSAAQMITLYGVDGSRRHEEFQLVHLKGYHGVTPVRVGNQASSQRQLDIFGELLEVSWLWHQKGYAPSDHYWEFLVDLIDHVCQHWQQPDHGIWELRGEPQNFVHSKVMCWSALNRGIGLAHGLGRKAPTARWEQARKQVHEAVEEYGYDKERGIFVQSFESNYLDASLLKIPGVGFIDYCDDRMLRTTEAIRTGLDFDGLLYRYNSQEGLPRKEGAFLPCSFWLAECLAHQHRAVQAKVTFERAAASANDLGLFSEQYDPHGEEFWGNYPQGLTHLSYITAALALRKAGIDTNFNTSQ